MNINEYTEEQRVAVARLVKNFNDAIQEIVLHEVDTATLVHKKHTEEDQCGGVTVFSETDVGTLLEILNRGVDMIEELDGVSSRTTIKVHPN